MLLTVATGLSHVQLISRAHDVITTTQMMTLDALVTRRLSGEPMAYILGSREFFGRDFLVSPAVLIPRPDTELLVEVVLNLPSRTQNIRALDLGTGSGAIAITLACERPDWRVCAVDVSGAALMVARENATRLDAHVSFFESDWFSVFQGSNAQFDIIVSNPPYIEPADEHLSQGDVRFEPITALTDGIDGLSCYRTLLLEVATHLAVGGHFVVEHGFTQGEAVRDLFAQAGFSSIQTHRDLAGHERVTLGILQGL
ncbi:hypothetical protein GCM10009007_08270 [Formosimonas limnophila]|uniref:Release factor glutamine methyltransferase n=2 Tax=Formosimonas limnophila TaxID=1384487 RepID=A0A8J3FZ02_9BURK|nr:hypothetical protein GCM10009007_08270 [Formosimonas limnophila]